MGWYASTYFRQIWQRYALRIVHIAASPAPQRGSFSIIMADFKTSLESGKETESLVLKLIKKKYPSAYIIEGYYKEYDIFIPEVDIGVEVKQDKKSMYTNNLVIEIEFGGKPSALSTTKADCWVFYDGKELIWITPNKLRWLTRDMRPAVFVGDGDTVKKKAYLVKKDLIKENSVNKFHLKKCQLCRRMRKSGYVSGCSFCGRENVCLDCYNRHLPRCNPDMYNYQQQLKMEL
jgi:hypothetical protein